MTNTKTIVLLGVRRSGLHAVCNWLIGSCPGRVHLVNDPPLDDQTLPDLAHSFNVSGTEVVEEFTKMAARTAFLRRAYVPTARLPHFLRKPLMAFVARRVRTHSFALPSFGNATSLTPNLRIILLENLTPEDAKANLLPWLRKQDLNPADCQLGFIIRSPWNCLASHLESPHETPPRGALPSFIPGIWKSLAREACGDSTFLQDQFASVSTISYDKLVCDPDYRNRLGAELGIAPSDLGLGKISDFGEGSSFGGYKMDASTITDQIGKRWRKHAENSTMQGLLNDAEVTKLANQLGFARI